MKKRIVKAGVAAAALALAASAVPAVVQAAPVKQLTIVSVLGPLSDPFFPPFHQGLVDAAAAQKVKLDYLSAPENSAFAVSYAKLLQQAIAIHPAGLIVGDYDPSAFDPLIKKAVKAGIPVILDQDGQPNWQPDGAIAYVGQNVADVGAPASAAFTKAKKINVLCMDKGAGNPYLEQICKSLRAAVTKAGGTVTIYEIPLADSTNPATESADVVAQLQKNPKLNAVFTEGAQDATDAIAGIKSLGKTGKVAVGTLALNTQVLTDIQSGSLTFALDEQPYLDGYYGLTMMAQYDRYGLLPTNPLYLGYVTVDKGNVARVEAVQAEYPGIRGSN